MASAAPALGGGGTGLQVPVGIYTAGVVDSFPRVNRPRPVEASIADRISESHAPVNQTTSQKITDRYLHFHIRGSQGCFYDLSTLAIELCMTLTKKDGAALDAATNVVLTNGLSNVIFRNAQVFIGDKLVESAPLNSYTSYIKMLSHQRTHMIKLNNRLTHHYLDYRGSGIKNTFDEAYFTSANAFEKKVMRSNREHGLHLIGSLFLDITSLDSYLLDNIDFKLKLELASDQWVMNSNAALTDINLNINSANLLVDKIIPRAGALMALHKSLSSPNAILEYLYTNHVTRTYTLGVGQTSMSITSPWQNNIPSKLYMCFIEMQNFVGDNTRNGIYFGHHNLENLNVTLNGSNIYNINCNFPEDFSQLYYATCKTLGHETDHLIHYDSFNSGRMIACLGFNPESTEDTFNIERNGQLKIDLRFGTAPTSNIVVLLVGEMQATLQIDARRTILTQVRG